MCGPTQPIIRNFDLVSVNNLLLENTIAVSQSVPPGGIVETGKTVEETSRQSAQAAVAQGGVVLLADDVLDAEAEISEPALGDVLLADVEHGVVEGPAHEELQAQVVDPLAVGEGLALLGPVPLQDEAVPEGQAGGGVCGLLVAVEDTARQGGLDVADDLALEAILVLEALGLVLGPSLPLGLGDGSCAMNIVSICTSSPGIEWGGLLGNPAPRLREGSTFPV